MKRITWVLAAAMTSGLASLVPSAAHARAIDGPRMDTSNVDAAGANRYYIEFYGGETGVVRVVGDGDTNLEVKVYDTNGNLISSDTDNDGSGYCECRFVPYFTQTFTIRVLNHGNVYNHYSLKTN